jgi:hypothetical protein
MEKGRDKALARWDRGRVAVNGGIAVLHQILIGMPATVA